MNWDKKTWIRYASCAIGLLFVTFALGMGMKCIANVTMGLETEATEFVEETEVKEFEYLDIVVYGLDNRDAGETDYGRTDVILIASINQETKEVRLVSVLRDMMIEKADASLDKINTAYETGGADEAVETLNRNLDLNIEKYVTVDWGGVVKVIDDLGGVDITIEPDEIASLNECIPEVDQLTGYVTEWITESGLVHLNGTQATAYARIRSVDNDMMRTSRQRIVLQQVLVKAKQANMLQLATICKDAFAMVSTNISIGEILGLAADVKEYQIIETRGFPSSIEPYTIGEFNYVVPVDLSLNVEFLHEWLYPEKKYELPVSVKEISEKIAGETGIHLGGTESYNYEGLQDTVDMTGTGEEKSEGTE